MGFPPLFYCGVAALSQKRDVTRLKDRWKLFVHCLLILVIENVTDRKNDSTIQPNYCQDKNDRCKKYFF
jgi:hypothetical protein